jgi:[ribosomal protein S5]-alanine N-acetyltransferase
LKAERLRSIAKAAAPDVSVTAQTLPEESASTRVLRKLGFVLKGLVIDPAAGAVWEWSDEKAKL